MIDKRIYSKEYIDAIYDSGNYVDKFEQDLVEAEKRYYHFKPGYTC